jgi:hypothetical protein
MSRKSEGLGDNIWILIPLTALMIPIFAVIGSSENPAIAWVVAAVIALGAVTLAIRSLMTHRHNLLMEELEARERITRAEREHLSAAERILELDHGLADLDEAVKRPNDPQAG